MLLVIVVLRIRREEQFLKADPAYQRYQVRIPWRLFPIVY